jgi:hypothetical protein
MKVTLTIPESYKDITVSQYQKWFKIVQENDPSDFVNLKTIEIFCQTKDARLLPINAVDEAIKDINRVFETMPKLVQRFKLNGVEFGLIPNFDEMSFGEYVDINSYIDNVEDFHKALAVLYRPIVAKVKDLYEIEDYKGSDVWSEQMKFAPLDTILGAKVFFYDLANELLQATINSLEELPPAEREIIQQKLSSLSGGDGINLSMHSLKEMLGTSMKLPSYEYTNV